MEGIGAIHNFDFGGTILTDLLDSMLEGCQIIDRDWRYVYVNETAAHQVRKLREELIGQTMPEVYPGIEQSVLFDKLRQCMEQRTPKRFKNEISFADGSSEWFELRVEPIPTGVFILSLDISESKRSEQEQRILYELLELINSSDEWQPLLKSLLGHLQKWSGCEAVGIRLKQGADFPYFETIGFSDEFVRQENLLCSYNEQGEVELDEAGQPKVECMCGNILCGRYDPSKSFFTSDGSFWCNCTSELLATTSDADRQARTRNRCNGEGYESVALIPLRAGGETFGLLQFNDPRTNLFTPQKIALFRRVADRISNFLARKKAEDRLQHLNKTLSVMRQIGQLIVREQNPHLLIEGVCKLLVDVRGFEAVVIALTDSDGTVLYDHVMAGNGLNGIVTSMEQGLIPSCGRRALTKREEVYRHSGDPLCRGCPVVERFAPSNGHLILPLQGEKNSFGFMIVCLPAEIGDDSEEHVLLKELADDITFAMIGMELKGERDQSRAELAAIEQQLRQAQRLDSIGRLAGGIAHDFNNILAAQFGYCDLMRKRMSGDDPLVMDLDKIKTCAARAAGLTRQLLAFSRKQMLQPEILILNRVVEGIKDMLQRLLGENIELSTHLSDDLGKVKADPGQLEQVIVNLAVNARDAMPQGGTLRLETANVELDAEYARRHRNARTGPHVMLAVSDTGCGMDQQTRERLFEPFFTTKEQGKGTGLGLATVYGIVKQSGGNIWVYSELGQGTVIKVYLPRQEGKLNERQSQPTAFVSGQGQQVLLVEDEPYLSELFSRMLEELGYRVEMAPNGEVALSLVEEQGLRPDLLLTDVIMPRMSGRDLAEKLSRRLPKLKVLFTSGYSDNVIVHQGVLDPGIWYIEKPFTTVQLASKIHEVLSS